MALDFVKKLWPARANKISERATTKPQMSSSVSFNHGDVDVDRYLTDRPPQMQNYRRLASIVEQIQTKGKVDLPTVSTSNGDSGSDAEKGSSKQQSVKFGWFQGVFMRCTLNILGVMLYLRISWVTGQAGIGLSALVVLLSSTVTTLTALSVCAIVTNGEVKGGGAYFMISRSLGPEFGGAIGLIFSFANAVGAAMHIVGIAETCVYLLKQSETQIIDADVWDMRIFGEATLLLLLIVCFIGVSFESKMQGVLMVLLIISIVNYYVGLCIPYSDEKHAQGAVDFSIKLFAQNFVPDFDVDKNFFTVFAVYFPAATGIMAGANISGDLKEPGHDIPLGTLLAILTTTLTYLSVAVLTGFTSVRYASGSLDDLNYLRNQSLTEDTEWYLLEPPCLKHGKCDYGLMNSGQVVTLTSAWGPLIMLGIFAATLSSALASLVSAPKIFQAVCNDNLFPWIGWFGKGFGKDNEPRRALVLTAIIAFCMIMIADLNAIAPMISNFFLATYALINYSVFDATFAGSPGFRPSFKYYNRWASLIGAVLCVVMMFVMSWIMALVTMVIIAVIYVYILRRKLGVNWGSSDQAHSYRFALNWLYKLQGTPHHVKNYRPQILLLSGNPLQRPSLVDFASAITKDNSLLICAHVIDPKKTDNLTLAQKLKNLRETIPASLMARKIKAFYVCLASESFYKGAEALMQQVGMGRLRPNIVMMGYHRHADQCSTEHIKEYCDVIHDAFEFDYGFCLLKLGSDMDISDAVKELGLTDIDLVQLSHELSKAKKDKIKAFKNGNLKQLENIEVCISDVNPDSLLSTQPSPNGDIDCENKTMESVLDKITVDQPPRSKKSVMYDIVKRVATQSHRDLLVSINQCRDKVKNGIIDVWWLHDDGGLTILLPHLLTLKQSFLQGAKMRILTVANANRDFQQEQKQIAELLIKLRIPHSYVKVVSAVNENISGDSQSLLMKLAKKYADSSEDEILKQMMPFETRTRNHLRNGQLIMKHSGETASLVVITLPMTKPKEGRVPYWLYQSWLDVLTSELHLPTLFVRGNQEPVLTFYSS